MYAKQTSSNMFFNIGLEEIADTAYLYKQFSSDLLFTGAL